eukprot:scaffold173651_cov29-Tisochrysis_lutea.AAC.2
MAVPSSEIISRRMSRVSKLTMSKRRIHWRCALEHGNVATSSPRDMSSSGSADHSCSRGVRPRKCVAMPSGPRSVVGVILNAVERRRSGPPPEAAQKNSSSAVHLISHTIQMVRMRSTTGTM